MSLTDTELFTRLKEAVQTRAAERVGLRKAAKEWSLNDISDFQADLESVCKSSVSEKWFYTHFKNESDKLPRVDVLNLLSQYCGYKNWDDFCFANQSDSTPKKRSKNWLVWLIIPVVGIVVVLSWRGSVNHVVLVFKDAYTHDIIEARQLVMKFKEQELKFKVSQSTLAYKPDTLLIDGAYYKAKKVFLQDEPRDTLTIELFPDDYALMLNYFSRSASTDWQKRHEQLMEAIHPEAKIFQSHPQYEGIELLNREEFIDRLILPLNSLKNLEIQDIVYKDDKIYRLRFIQKIEEDERN